MALLSLLSLALAYQIVLPIRVQVGGALDRPYAVNFQAPQKDDDTLYRLTRTDSMLVFPGIGGGIPRRLTVTTRLAKPTRPTRLTLDIQSQV
ncbi:hypothetical protein DWB58_23415, partial [candidate division KSB1 bacterium]|nr:hypothetical protein [candidate division KSB1 bacterium]